MTAPRGKARNRFFRASDGPRWNKGDEINHQVVNRTASAGVAIKPKGPEND